MERIGITYDAVRRSMADLGYDFFMLCRDNSQAAPPLHIRPDWDVVFTSDGVRVANFMFAKYEQVKALWPEMQDTTQGQMPSGKLMLEDAV